MRADRRQYPRVNIRLPVEVVVGDQAGLKATAVNLSRAGLQLSCDGWTAQRIVPKGHYATLSHELKAQVRFNLRFTDQSETCIEGLTQIVYSRRLSQDEFRIGLQYGSLEADAEEALERYIIEHTRIRASTQLR